MSPRTARHHVMWADEHDGSRAAETTNPSCGDADGPWIFGPPAEEPTSPGAYWSKDELISARDRASSSYCDTSNDDDDHAISMKGSPAGKRQQSQQRRLAKKVTHSFKKYRRRHHNGSNNSEHADVSASPEHGIDIDDRQLWIADFDNSDPGVAQSTSPKRASDNNISWTADFNDQDEVAADAYNEDMLSISASTVAHDHPSIASLETATISNCRHTDCSSNKRFEHDHLHESSGSIKTQLDLFSFAEEDNEGNQQNQTVDNGQHGHRNDSLSSIVTPSNHNISSPAHTPLTVTDTTIEEEFPLDSFPPMNIGDVTFGAFFPKKTDDGMSEPIKFQAEPLSSVEDAGTSVQGYQDRPGFSSEEPSHSSAIQESSLDSPVEEKVLSVENTDGNDFPGMEYTPRIASVTEKPPAKSKTPTRKRVDKSDLLIQKALASDLTMPAKKSPTRQADVSPPQRTDATRTPPSEPHQEDTSTNKPPETDVFLNLKEVASSSQARRATSKKLGIDDGSKKVKFSETAEMRVYDSKAKQQGQQRGNNGGRTSLQDMLFSALETLACAHPFMPPDISVVLCESSNQQQAGMNAFSPTGHQQGVTPPDEIQVLDSNECEEMPLSEISSFVGLNDGYKKELKARLLKAKSTTEGTTQAGDENYNMWETHRGTPEDAIAPSAPTPATIVFEKLDERQSKLKEEVVDRLNKSKTAKTVKQEAKMVVSLLTECRVDDYSDSDASSITTNYTYDSSNIGYSSLSRLRRAEAMKDKETRSTHRRRERPPRGRDRTPRKKRPDHMKKSDIQAISAQAHECSDADDDVRRVPHPLPAPVNDDSDNLPLDFAKDDTVEPDNIAVLGKRRVDEPLEKDAKSHLNVRVDTGHADDGVGELPRQHDVLSTSVGLVTIKSSVEKLTHTKEFIINNYDMYSDKGAPPLPQRPHEHGATGDPQMVNLQPVTIDGVHGEGETITHREDSGIDAGDGETGRNQDSAAPTGPDDDAAVSVADQGMDADASGTTPAEQMAATNPDSDSAHEDVGNDNASENKGESLMVGNGEPFGDLALRIEMEDPDLDPIEEESSSRVGIMPMVVKRKGGGGSPKNSFARPKREAPAFHSHPVGFNKVGNSNGTGPPSPPTRRGPGIAARIAALQEKKFFVGEEI